MYKKSVNTSNNKTQFDKAELNIEFKKSKASEPFVDDPNLEQPRSWPFEADTKQGKGTRAQLTEYMAEVFSRQHRLFGFTLFICGPLARFIRWDRAGAIVSKQFDYCKDSQPLVQFLWRFCHLDDAKRGHDPSVRPATSEEVKLAKEKLSKWRPRKECPVVVFTVPDDNGNPREFMGWGSMAAPYSIIGRCTRAFPVYEKATDKCYFLKDVWRAYMLDPEADVLRELAEKQVEHIPKFLCGGDIDGQVTETDLYVPKEEPLPMDKPRTWPKGDDWSRITQRFHHRFVMDCIGKSLKEFENSKQLMQVVSDAFTGE
ncbi:hypothetical protein C0995_014897 [Termitomyces sp. Mi166|nr:hypothetical protein C0995_014897 [Termitomyces sp. Mi166\